jgi:hypothetical protein
MAWSETNEGAAKMRKLLLTVLATAAIGCAGISVTTAAPLNPAPLNQASDAVNNVTKVWHCRYWSGGWGCGGGGHWRWGSRGGCRRCNPWRCWWVC